MEYALWGITLFISEIIGSWEKPWKQKILPFTITYTIACILLVFLFEANGAKGSLLTSIFIQTVLMLITTVFATLPPSTATKKSP
ncbi:hypothetical protein [uncultured Cardiobacterium sp.]|uniref:hypothetical protein n=1 Tax=uncultured Cardiobacterium sp. TaxID=417619 RepID=UPI002606BE61|nr:hypothetical protein [uncultured Cardiobacterium sp.]